MSKCLFALVLIAKLSACAPHRIPGTDIDDTDDTRAILSVIEKYRRAMEARDAEALLQLASSNFKDDAGTGTPADDLDYPTLQQVLPKRLSEVQDLRLDLTVKKILVDPKTNTAQAVYNFNTSFRIPRYAQKTQQESGLKMMTLTRDGEGWKLVSGI